jgi:hypothetical protein
MVLNWFGSKWIILDFLNCSATAFLANLWRERSLTHHRQAPLSRFQRDPNFIHNFNLRYEIPYLYKNINMSDLKLLTKVTMGDQELQNRLVLAPLTRARYAFNQLQILICRRDFPLID